MARVKRAVNANKKKKKSFKISERLFRRKVKTV